MQLLRFLVNQCKLAALLPVIALLLSAGPGVTADENAVKAMFIYNFTRYFDWHQSSDEREFVIAVYGRSAVTRYLEEIALRKEVNERKIVIRNVTRISEVKGARILFVPAENASVLHLIMQEESCRSVVLVSEGDGMTRKGAHISLITIDGKLRFELNETALRNQEIKYAKELGSLSIKQR